MTLTPQQIARKATELGISGRAESLAELVKWAMRQMEEHTEVNKEQAA